ncbi:MAG: dUTP diphosphatase [Candidatus Aminicenantes bacterium]|nr:dUTP diphosphatase [Candidatus Aminicenantes bacterium]
MELKVERINGKAKLPVFQHDGDAGMDLYSVESCSLRQGEARAVSTGIRIAVPPGYAGLIWDKSGLSLKGLHRLAGVIDSGYRGEVKVVLVNLGRDTFTIEQGKKIAQLLIQKIETVRVVEVENLDKTSRGENGFGSTGEY